MSLTQPQLDAWIVATDARLAKLEGLPVSVESPNGTTINQATQFLTVKGVVWTLLASVGLGMQLRRNGVLRPETNNVVLCFRLADAFWQKNAIGNYYSADAAGVWSAPRATDPRLPPVIVTVVPTPAALVGYNTRTLGPAVTLGQIWRKSSDASTAKQNADGSVTMAGPWQYNDLINTLGQLAFGGGAYMEAAFKFDGAYAGADGVGWPSFWGNTLEGRSLPFPNQRGVELDICEFWGASNWGSAVHDWYGGAGAKLTQGLAVNMPSGQAGNQIHKYGCLWVLATATTKGRVEFYFDRVRQDAMTISWNLYNPNDQPPYTTGTTAGADLDVQHLDLKLGTGAGNPMTVYSVEVWQKSGARNLPPS